MKLNTSYTVTDDKVLYESNGNLTSHINGEVTCCFPGCSHKPSVVPGEVDVNTGDKLHRSLCEIHEEVFSVTKPSQWGKLKKYYELWDRTPILLNALNANIKVWPRYTKEWLYTVFYPELQEQIDSGDLKLAKNTARGLRCVFDCDHILGSKVYGDSFIVPLDTAMHSVKSTLLGDNIKNSDTHTKATMLYNCLTDDVLQEMDLDYTQEDLHNALTNKVQSAIV